MFDNYSLFYLQNVNISKTLFQINKFTRFTFCRSGSSGTEED